MVKLSSLPLGKVFNNNEKKTKWTSDSLRPPSYKKIKKKKKKNFFTEDFGYDCQYFLYFMPKEFYLINGRLMEYIILKAS